MTSKQRAIFWNILAGVVIGGYLVCRVVDARAEGGQDQRQTSGAPHTTYDEKLFRQLIGEEMAADGRPLDREALQKLAALDSASKEALIEPLIVWMTSYEPEGEPNRGLAITPLSKIGKPAVPKLIEAMKRENRYAHGDDDHRNFVASALGDIGPTAKEAIAMMVEVLHESPRNDPVEEAILEALPKMGAEGIKARDVYLSSPPSHSKHSIIM
jgi:hypothetical protein